MNVEDVGEDDFVLELGFAVETAVLDLEETTDDKGLDVLEDGTAPRA